VTLSSTQTRITYSGDGATTHFAVPFAFFGASELTVIERRLDTGAKMVKYLGTHYSISGGNGETGTVTAAIPPLAGMTWTITRKTSRTQLVDYTPNDPFPAETHERALDRQAAVSQELDDALSRSAQLSATTSLDGLEMPDPEAYRFLRWNGSADGLENAEIQSASSVVQAGDSVMGVVELAIAPEVRAGLDAERAMTPSAAAALWRQGADIVSAAKLAKPADPDLGGYHAVTGSSTVTGLWTGEADGTEIELRFTAACGLTHHATDFILPGGINVTTIPDDVARFRSEAGKWRCVSAPPRWYTQTPSFSANKGGVDQTGIASATSTKLTFATEEWDIGGYYDASSSVYLPPAGKYHFTADVIVTAGLTDQSVCFVALYKNGDNYKSGSSLRASGTGYLGPVMSVLANANGSDYFEVYFFCDGTGTKTIQGVARNASFQAVKVA
jgi:hypothetical protein